MNTVKRDIAVALIFSKDGKIFQGQKDPKGGGVYADGYWHIPGGGVEEGERIEDALVREVKEETGIDVTNSSKELIDVDKGVAEKKTADGEIIKVEMKFHTYKVNLSIGSADLNIVLDDDLVKYRWTHPEELSTLKLTPPSTKLFTKLGYLE